MTNRPKSQRAAELKYEQSGKRPERVTVGVKLTTAQAKQLDNLRGSIPRAQYLRQCAGL